MKGLLSTREAAEHLGISLMTLQRHIAARTLQAPALQKIGGVLMRLWSKRDIARARKVLAAVRPGRKRKA